MIYREFKEQLLRESDGTYQTRLQWKEGNDFLPDKSGHLAYLHCQLRKFKEVPDHHNIIKRVPQYHSRATIIWYSRI